MKCKCKEDSGYTTIACCNECGLPLKTEPWKFIIDRNDSSVNVEAVVILHQNAKLICIDYDGTFTAAPELFRYFIIKAKKLNYKVIGCTMRFEHEIDDGLQQLNELVDKLYFSGRQAKQKYLALLKVYPQIWIDDMPEWIFTDTV